MTPANQIIERGTRVLIALGGNLGGERAVFERIHQAVDLFAQRLAAGPVSLSRVYSTAPVGPVPDQPRFLNAAAELHLAADMDAVALMAEILAIEAELGRVRAGAVPQGPRLIDLDLIAAGEHVMAANGPPRLEVPHPRACERAFVLVPLAELVGLEWRIPGQARTVAECLAEPTVASQAADLTPYMPPALPVGVRRAIA